VRNENTLTNKCVVFFAIGILKVLRHKIARVVI